MRELFVNEEKMEVRRSVLWYGVYLLWHKANKEAVCADVERVGDAHTDHIDYLSNLQPFIPHAINLLKYNRHGQVNITVTQFQCSLFGYVCVTRHYFLLGIHIVECK